MARALDLSSRILSDAQHLRATESWIQDHNLSPIDSIWNTFNKSFHKLSEPWGRVVTSMGPDPVNGIAWLIKFYPNFDQEQLSAFSDWRDHTRVVADQMMAALYEVPGEERDGTWRIVYGAAQRIIDHLATVPIDGVDALQMVRNEAVVIQHQDCQAPWWSAVRTLAERIDELAAETWAVIAVSLGHPEHQFPATLALGILMAVKTVRLLSPGGPSTEPDAPPPN
jgi:hypothetical protein